MSTATLERVAASEIEYGEWTTGNNGSKARNWFVCRHQVDNYGGPMQYHENAKGDMIWYTMAGAEKKAHELNREAAAAKRRDAYLAKIEAERLEQPAPLIDLLREEEKR